MNIDFDLTCDAFFKYLFYKQEVAASFIECFIQEPIHEFSLMQTEVKTNYLDAKPIVFDYACMVNKNIIVTIEMQRGYLTEEKLVERMGYYLFRSGAQLLSQGEAYKERNKLYTIVLCPRSPFKKDKYEREMNLQDYEHYLKFTKARLIFYDMGEVYRLCYGQNVETLTSQQVWILYLMQNYHEMSQEYLDQLMKRKELSAVNTHISQAQRDKLKAVVKVMEDMQKEDILYFRSIEEENLTLIKKYVALTKKLSDQSQKLSEKDQKIAALEQMLKNLQTPMMQS